MDTEKKKIDKNIMADSSGFAEQRTTNNEQRTPPLGIRCPTCGCADFKDEDGRPWEVLNVKKIPGAIRRYMICRYCGRRVRTKEIIEK